MGRGSLYIQFLLFGWGCVFWQAIALQYGRRPVYLISLLGTMVGCISSPDDILLVAHNHTGRHVMATAYLIERPMGGSKGHSGIFRRTHRGFGRSHRV